MEINKKYFLIFLIILFSHSISFLLPQEILKNTKKITWSAFPILMYDSDIGFGYGGKGIIKNIFKKDESFDLILFNSTKGEHWYVFTFSIPDFEIRQRKAYPLSFDLKIEYDRILKDNFFGLGIDSKKADHIIFTKEWTTVQFTLGRGFTENFFAEISYNLKNISYLNIEKDNRGLTDILKEVGSRSSPFISFNIRYDTSDSQIHPLEGLRLALIFDLSNKSFGNKNFSFNKITLDFRKYTSIFKRKGVFAFRLLFQTINGSKIPIFEYGTLGGGSTMRGFILNRFADKKRILSNIEYRFPIWKKIGGNILLDAGNLSPNLREINWNKWKYNLGAGLRYYLQNFVVRFDMGLSPEGTRIYFNFGHLF
ncbi:MAG: BamA/TamA family outer membrane protein [Acidobacteriota bacterium]